MPAGELVLVEPTPAGELVPVVLAAPAALLRPVDVLVLPVELLVPVTPEHGATVGEVALVLLGEMVTPATLQFNGICCSMIST